MTTWPAFRSPLPPAIDPAAGGHNRWHRRCDGVDLQGAGRVGYRAREIGAVARGVADRCPVQVDRRHRKVAGVLAGANRVAEGQRVAAGAAGVARRAAIVERQRRHAARNRHHLAHVEVSVTTWPAFRSPLPPAVDAAAGGHNRWHRRRVVSICRVPVGLIAAPERSALLPAASLTVAPFRLNGRHRKVAGVLAGANRVAEGQRVAAGAAGVGRGAAIVERQRRHAARNRHHFAHVERQRDHVAGIQVTIAACRRCRCRRPQPMAPSVRGIDLQGAGRVGYRARKIGAVARRVADRRPVQVERRHRKVAGVLAGANRVAEGQRVAAGAAGVGRRAAVVERQRRHAARNRHHLAHVDRQRDHVAGIQVTIAACVDAAARGHNRWHRRCRRIDLQGAGRVGYRTRKIGVVACGVADRRPVQVDGRHRKVAGVLAGANRVAEGQRVAAGAAGIASRCRHC